MLFPTTLVGSYCQPDWLIDREKLKGQFPPRTRAKELWRIPEPLLKQAQDDATLIAIRDQERAGLDILTDGEIRRESYSNRFATALEGLDLDNYGQVMTRSGKPVPVPRIVGPIRRVAPHRTRRPALPARQHRPADQDHPARPLHHVAAGAERILPTARRCRDGLCPAVREEMADLFAAGADVVQLDEPWMQAKPDLAEDYGLEPRSMPRWKGRPGTTAVHICFGYAALTKDRPEAIPSCRR
jgi:5-methyltetrahydropteroyltriglutamate--homocysteine methyltransferase